jgi:hypothetical protein
MSRPAAIAFIALTLLAGCQKVEEYAGNCQRPPALRNETIPQAPIAEYVQTWQPGFWDWRGGGYVWTEGRWVRNTGQGNQWMQAYWDRPTTPGSCVWVPAHWM